MLSITSCSDDFLTASSTEKLEAGGTATEGSILSNLASAYQILLFDSYANSNYNAVLLMSDLRSDDLYKGGGVQETRNNFTSYLNLPLLQLLLSMDYGVFISQVWLVATM